MVEASFILIGLGLLIFLVYLVLEIKEVLFLKQTLNEVIGSPKINGKPDLIKLKKYLNNIQYDSEKKTVKRPILRHTASQILKMQYGFCGENARVAIKLFLLGGVKAARIYLYGEKWGHVVIEHKMNNSWYLFDGHYDPLTVLKDDDIASIESRQLNKYPNGYPENNYVDYCRIKLFYKIGLLKKLAKLRLPSFLIYCFESPYLIKAGSGIVVTFAGLLLYCIST